MAICYKDITFCARKCKNIKCERNMKHAEKAPLHGLPLSMCDYSDCKEWEGEDKKMDKKLEIRTAEAKACEQFVNSIFKISKKYNLDFPAELEKLSTIVTASTIQNTRKEEKQND